MSQDIGANLKPFHPQARGPMDRLPDGFAIAFIVLQICVVCTVVATRFQPTVYAVRVEPPKVVKLQDRINKEKS